MNQLNLHVACFFVCVVYEECKYELKKYVVTYNLDLLHEQNIKTQHTLTLYISFVLSNKTITFNDVLVDVLEDCLN